jgi:hypothetical protein
LAEAIKSNNNATNHEPSGQHSYQQIERTINMARKRKTFTEEQYEEEEPVRKSLGTLTKNNCTTPRSPDLTGQCKIQRHLIKELAEELERSHGEEVTCDIAGWWNYDREGNKYLTVELSPKFRKRDRRGARADIVHFMRDGY